MLERINFPADLRRLELEALPALCAELREFLLDSVSNGGGHFSSNLGTVELTVALHYAFDTPQDKLVWDVGHQAYPHKILTGRRDLMDSIRQKDGLAGFPKRSESEYDTFGVGHSSTSISAALGMALAAQQKGEDYHSIAIIGDGAMTAGMAYEALNHAGDLDANLIVVLNDNEMSISPNVGALRKYLTRLLSGRMYSSMRESGKKALSHSKSLSKLVKLTEEHMKGMVLPGTLFEEMGFKYYGPIDGHDVEELVHVLENLKQIKGPRLLHILTQKGKGYEPAEEDPCAYHGVTPFNLKTGLVSSSKKSTPTYTQVFGQWLCDMAAQDKRLVGITPAMREGSGLVAFSEQFPQRYFDVGIAEQHAVTLAAGLACEGLKPVVAIYSTFLQRAYDQLLHDVAIQNLPVVFAVDRAGLVGADGPTHSGNYDLSFLRCVPNMVVMAPADENECRQMLYTAFQLDCPTAVRYPRGKGTGIEPHTEMQAMPVGKAVKVRNGGNSIAILLFGSLLAEARAAAEELDATLVNMRFVKPLDKTILRELAQSHELLVTLEDNAVMGGAGSAVNEYLHEAGLAVEVMNLGLPDVYIEHAQREEQLAACGLDALGIVEKVRSGYGGRIHIGLSLCPVPQYVAN
ncbi:1-deoxy-D-xylulose-5-phosphate synthase [Thiothrix nivea]|uniref:1-deoxy-D-xylulose-5-phosphate synthase n=1 Tax=Thiothrix nivea (strain ATCC 35100 / DSM 5205 / JP2) TaxID=870187 RepID=A0A656HK29_THINJ|nr:1-deoxy-D-xylulose-5-phosphate synthase [Thiothrix nivea]EIJ35866.1 1-deoxy-D-xylulose-5-phosphate synthase [Thiothrix nivea DSM 5205]